nr:glycosyltransferase [Gluconobacter oxydans]
MYLCSDIGGAIGWRFLCSTMEKFKFMSVEEFNFLKNKNVFFPKKSQKSFIEKSIHQVFLGESIPEKLLEASYNVKNINPDWKYNFYDEKDVHDFIYEFYGWDILRYYMKINPRYGAARADFFRYLCIYQNGGCYLDMKAGLNKPLSSIVRPDDHFLLSQWRNKLGEPYEDCGLGPEVSTVKGGEYQQWNIIGSKGHPYLEAVINSVLSRLHHYRQDYFGVGKLGVLRLTGPYPYTMSINKILNYHPHRFYDSHESGVIYSVVDNHEKTLKNHYSMENTPIVL